MTTPLLPARQCHLPFSSAIFSLDADCGRAFWDDGAAACPGLSRSSPPLQAPRAQLSPPVLPRLPRGGLLHIPQEDRTRSRTSRGRLACGGAAPHRSLPCGSHPRLLTAASSGFFPSAHPVSGHRASWELVSGHKESDFLPVWGTEPKIPDHACHMYLIYCKRCKVLRDSSL